MASKKNTYKENMEKLDEIIVKLEQGELSVEESIENYEAGMKLTKNLLFILNQAEEKVKIMDGQEEVEF